MLTQSFSVPLKFLWQVFDHQSMYAAMYNLYCRILSFYTWDKPLFITHHCRSAICANTNAITPLNAITFEEIICCSKNFLTGSPF